MDLHPKAPAPLAICLAMLLAVLVLLGAVPAATAAPAATARAGAAATASTVTVSGCGTAKALGTYYADAYVRVHACGIRPSFDGARTGTGPVVRPFAGSMTYYRGFQCIELVARFLKARHGVDPGRANGAQAVDRYAAAYPATFVRIANGTRRQSPRKGDVLSLSANRFFNDVGHTGVVIGSRVNRRGNGKIRAVEQNWGGAGGARGLHVYKVRNWRVQSPGLPHVKWLRAR